jgi:hypothetical protein
MSEHPVPRIEIVYRTAPVGLVDEDPPQRWHVRNIGGNGEITKTSEQLVDIDACETNIVADAVLFGWPDGYVSRNDVGPEDGVRMGTVVLDPDGKTGRRIPVLLRVEP